MIEEIVEEFFLVDFFCGVADGLCQFVVRCRDEARQVHVFDLIPAWLDRIQLRRVRRKVFELEPIGMRVREVRIGGVVC